MNARAALIATAFAFELALRTANVDASATYNTGYDRAGLQDAHIPGGAAVDQLLRGAVERIAKQLT